MGVSFNTMVASHLLLMNHLLLSLSYNLPPEGLHPNSIGGLVDFKSSSRDKVPLVSYRVAVGEQRDFPCGVGCSHCSPYNGCMDCAAPFYFTLRRTGSLQRGHCTRRCPDGYFKLKLQSKRYCSRCLLKGCKVCRTAERCRKCDVGHTRNRTSEICTEIEDIGDGLAIKKKKKDSIEKRKKRRRRLRLKRKNRRIFYRNLLKKLRNFSIGHFTNSSSSVPHQLFNRNNLLVPSEVDYNIKSRRESEKGNFSKIRRKRRRKHQKKHRRKSANNSSVLSQQQFDVRYLKRLIRKKLARLKRKNTINK